MNELNWDREALDNGDGPPTVVAYDDKGNELFYVYEVQAFDYWIAYISYGPKKHKLSKRVGAAFPDRESAEEICEHLYRLAEINHGYSNDE